MDLKGQLNDFGRKIKIGLKLTFKERILLTVCTFLFFLFIIINLIILNILADQVFQAMAVIGNVIITTLVILITDEDKTRKDCHIKTYSCVLLLLLTLMILDPYVIENSVMKDLNNTSINKTNNETIFINSCEEVLFKDLTTNYRSYLGKRVWYRGKVSDVTPTGDVNVFTLDVNCDNSTKMAVYVEGDINIKRGNKIIVYGIVSEKSDILDPNVLYPTMIAFYTIPQEK